VSDLDAQKPPVHNDRPSVHDLVIRQLQASGHWKVPAGREALARKLRERRELGLRRYGTVLQAYNGRDSLQDALDEAVDLVVYLWTYLEEQVAEPPNWLRRSYSDALTLAMTLAFQYEKQLPK